MPIEFRRRNIVGYAQSGLKSGFTMLTPQFLNVGVEKALPLESLKPVGTDIDTDGGIYIETLTAGGTMDQMYQWIDWGDPVGWCDDSFTLVEGVTFAPGQGLWVGGTGSHESLRFPAPEL